MQNTEAKKKRQKNSRLRWWLFIRGKRLFLKQLLRIICESWGWQQNAIIEWRITFEKQRIWRLRIPKNNRPFWRALRWSNQWSAAKSWSSKKRGKPARAGNSDATVAKVSGLVKTDEFQIGHRIESMPEKEKEGFHGMRFWPIASGYGRRQRLFPLHL